MLEDLTEGGRAVSRAVSRDPDLTRPVDLIPGEVRGEVARNTEPEALEPGDLGGSLVEGDRGELEFELKP